MVDSGNEIEGEVTKTWEQIVAATGRRDQKALDQLNNKLAELVELKTQDEAIKSRFRTLKNGLLPVDSFVRTTGAMREFYLPVTQGMINQSLLTLSEPVKRGKIRVGERLSIELPSGERFQTELLANGKKLRERGRIADFYRNARVRAGDVALLIEVTPDQWRLQKQI